MFILVADDSYSYMHVEFLQDCLLSNYTRVIRKVIGSFGVRYFRDSLYAVSLSVTEKYPKFAKISYP